MSASIDAHRLRELLASGAQLVEVLPEAEYREEHLPGAINIPLSSSTLRPRGSSTAIARSSSTAGTGSET